MTVNNTRFIRYMSYIVSISNIGKYTSFKIIHKFQSSEFEYIIIFVGGKFA